MVKPCCVKNCKSVSDGKERACKFSCFSFPLKNEELLKEWMDVIPTEKKIGKYTYICSRHFDKTSFSTIKGARKLCLKKDAVPSIFEFPEFSDVEETEIILDTPESMEDTEPIVEIMSAETAMILNSRIEKRDELRRKIKIIQQQLRRKKVELLNFGKVLELFKNKKQSSDVLDEVLEGRLSDFDRELFKNEWNNHKVPRNKKRYSEEMKDFATTIYCYSPELYSFLKAKLNLPNEATLRSWIGEE